MGSASLPLLVAAEGVEMKAIPAHPARIKEHKCTLRNSTAIETKAEHDKGERCWPLLVAIVQLLSRNHRSDAQSLA
jgi:hypothetical protein